MLSSKVLNNMAQNVRIILDLKELNKTNRLAFFLYSLFIDCIRLFSEKKTNGKVESERIKEFRKKLRTPIDKLPEFDEGKHPYQEKEPLKSFPDNTNPKTGEINGPRGPEPTRYGDWERKGRVTDF
ncbi:succinate dehydrogenase assembly factor 4, mitochondrial-like isoform X1 [Vespa velutina]|uniref:succinate dehydrogenase assembly factor 4, mitochondrial-like isoform X1 n=1 Tax=Vespa velutina TaxID=202808 RepID=UPI001FB368A8|nr:succinate dehydrogenase assembly factor 4, mitochondrial-like isoform X1 [Vespa velutina]